MASRNTQTHEDVVAAGLTEADQNIDNTEEDRRHAARGHKANLSNPNTSEASKKNSEKALRELGMEGEVEARKKA